MRFLKDGPDIPIGLIEARDRGKAVFLCGAGVSRDAGLPNFLKLTKSVVDALKCPEGSGIRNQVSQHERDPRFGPPLDQIFEAIYQEFPQTRVDAHIYGLLQPKSDAAVENHRIILALSRNVAGIPQVVTTNFDHLFERVGIDPRNIYSAPNLPEVGAQFGFEGLVYLHGRLEDPEEKAARTQNVILRASHFGRAYLAEGWATRFVRNLLSKHIVVLLGYAASDPPIKYLLAGLHAGRAPGSGSIYSFYSDEKKEGASDWDALGVHGIPYSSRGDDHTALWGSLKSWAEQAEDPESWRRSILVKSQDGPRNLEPYERGQVAALAATEVGAKLLSEYGPTCSSEWLFVFDPRLRYSKLDFSESKRKSRPNLLELYGVDRDPPRPEPSSSSRSGLTAFALFDEEVGESQLATNQADRAFTDGIKLVDGQPEGIHPLPRRLEYLALWLSKVMQEPLSAWWIAWCTCMHPHLLRRILHRLEDRHDGLDPKSRHVWLLLVESFTHRPGEYDWLRLQDRAKKDGWTPGTVREFERLIQPYLKVHVGIEALRDVTKMTAGEAWDKLLGRFQICFPPGHGWDYEFSTESHVEILSALCGGLNRARSLLDDIDQRSLWTETLIEEEGSGNESFKEADQYLRWVARLFDHTARESPDYARNIVAAWPDDDSIFFAKLKLYVWYKYELFSGSEIASGILLLSDEAFWNEGHRREFLHLLRRRWQEFTFDERLIIEARLNKDRAKREWESAEQFEENWRTEYARRIGWMHLNGLELDNSTIDSYSRIISGLREWHPEWAEGADSAYGMRSRPRYVDKDYSKLKDASPKEILAIAASYTEVSADGWVDRRPFQGLVENLPGKAADALKYGIDVGEYPEDHWQIALHAWAEDAGKQNDWTFADAISLLPEEFAIGIGHSVGAWLERFWPSLAETNLDRALAVWDTIVGKLTSDSAARNLEKQLAEATDVHLYPISYRTFGHASSSASGRVVAALMFEWRRREGDVDDLEKELLARIDRILSLGGEIAGQVVAVLASQMHWLLARQKAWVERALLPLFGPEAPSCEWAWSGLLAEPQIPSSSVFRVIKPYLLRIVGTMRQWRWGDMSQEHLYDWIVDACRIGRKSSDYLSFEETIGLLREMDDSGRSSVLKRVTYFVKRGNSWKEFAGPFIKHAWPEEKQYQSEETVRAFARLCLYSGEEFPEVFEDLRSYLSPIPQAPISPNLVYSGDHKCDIAKQYPETLLEFLDVLIPERASGPIYELWVVLSQISAAKPELRRDARWIRLNEIA